jgi:hypothetical protein
MKRKVGDGGGGGSDSDPSDLVDNKRRKGKIKWKNEKKRKWQRQRATQPGSDHFWSRSPSHGGEGKWRSPEHGGERLVGFGGFGLSGRFWEVSRVTIIRNSDLISIPFDYFIIYLFHSIPLFYN